VVVDDRHVGDSSGRARTVDDGPTAYEHVEGTHYFATPVYTDS
jgi:hypothetical protein